MSPKGLIVLTSLFVIFGSLGSDNSAMGENRSAPELQYRWEASPDGTPPVYYIVQLSVDGGEITHLPNVVAPVTQVPAVYGSEYKIRVAGVDEFGVQGPFSDWSIPYRPEFPPPEF